MKQIFGNGNNDCHKTVLLLTYLKEKVEPKL